MPDRPYQPAIVAQRVRKCVSQLVFRLIILIEDIPHICGSYKVQNHIARGSLVHIVLAIYTGITNG